MNRKASNLASLLILVLGLGFVFGSYWLFWDVTTTIVNWWTKPEFQTSFKFPLPGFVATADTWSYPVDISIGAMVIGVFLLIIGAYLIGYSSGSDKRVL